MRVMAVLSLSLSSRFFFLMKKCKRARSRSKKVHPLFEPPHHEHPFNFFNVPRWGAYYPSLGSYR